MSLPLLPPATAPTLTPLTCGLRSQREDRCDVGPGPFTQIIVYTALSVQTTDKHPWSVLESLTL